MDMRIYDTRGLGMIYKGLSAHFNGNFTREYFFKDTMNLVIINHSLFRQMEFFLFQGTKIW